MEEIQESRVRRKALLPKSKPTLFLYEGDSQKHSKMIGNVRYVTVSHYSSDKNIFEKVGELITRDFHSDEPDKVTNEISVGLSMDISDGKRCGFSKRYFLVLVACRHLTCTKTECRKMFLSLIAPLTTIRLNRGKRSNRLPYIFAQGQER